MSRLIETASLRGSAVSLIGTIRSELALLCELRESPEILDELERLRARIDAE